MGNRFFDIHDEELARRAGRGDTEAFGELVLRHQASVMRWVSWIDRKPGRTADLAQETFIKAWTARKTFRGASSWRNWVMKIALRVCLDQKRKYDPPTLPFDDVMPDHLILQDNNNPERLVMNRLQLEAVKKALDTIKPLHRAIVILRYMEGYNATEIGKMIGKPKGTVRRILFEARRSIAETMEQPAEIKKLKGSKQ